MVYFSCFVLALNEIRKKAEAKKLENELRSQQAEGETPITVKPGDVD